MKQTSSLSHAEETKLAQPFFISYVLPASSLSCFSIFLPKPQTRNISSSAASEMPHRGAQLLDIFCWLCLSWCRPVKLQPSLKEIAYSCSASGQLDPPDPFIHNYSPSSQHPPTLWHGLSYCIPSTAVFVSIRWISLCFCQPISPAPGILSERLCINHFPTLLSSANSLSPCCGWSDILHL